MTTFQLDPDEPLGEGLRRVALEQVDGALEALREGEDRNEAVHEARKRCKKVRAVLRLAREGLGDEDYRNQNDVHRDAARLLSAARDRWVLVETVDALQERYGRFLSAETLTPLRDLLAERHRLALERLLDVEHADERAAGTLDQAREEILKWRIEESSALEVVVAGVERVYRRGRKALARADAEATTRCFHEWRKQAKYLWYQARLLRLGSADKKVAILGDRLDRLSDLLGEEHDLALLGAELRSDRGLVRAAEQLQVVLGVIGQRRGELRKAALASGRRLYARKPKEVAARLERDWTKRAAAGDEVATSQDIAAPRGQPSGRARAVARFDPARRRQSPS